MNSHPFAKVIEIVGSQAELARLLNVSQPTVNQWVNGLRPVPANRAVTIERLTAGAVTRQDLRPHDYWRIWPDLPAPAQTSEQGAT